MFTWSHLYADTDGFGHGADGLVFRPVARGRARSLPFGRVALGRALVALGTAIAGPEDARRLPSAGAAR
jgi:hypothetical protein